MQDASGVQPAQQIAQQFTPWFPVIFFVLGQAAAIGLEWLRGRATSSRERQAREQARTAAFEDRRADFQRQTLVETQEAAFQLLRASGRIHIADLGAFRQSGEWGRDPVGEEINQQAHEAVVRVNTLRVRVLDEGLRGLLDQVREAHFAVISARSEAASDLALMTITTAYDTANARLGELLRSLY